MIGLFDDAGNRLGIGFNGLTFNDPVASKQDLIEVNMISMAGNFDAATDSDPQDDGTELTSVRRTMYILRIDGFLRAPTYAALYDRKKLVASKLDPAILYRNNLATFGALPLTFKVPTADTANYPSGFVDSFYTARTRGSVTPQDSMFTGRACAFAAEFMIPDPRRYFATQQSLAGAGTANNTLADEQSSPTVTITMTGAGSATYQHTLNGTTLTLNLSGRINGDVVTVDFKTHTVKVNGVVTLGVYVGGDYTKMLPGNNTVALANTTNATTVTSWYRAFAA